MNIKDDFLRYLDCKHELYDTFILGSRYCDKYIFLSDWTYDNWVRCHNNLWSENPDLANITSKRKYNTNQINKFKKLGIEFKLKEHLSFKYDYYRGVIYNIDCEIISF